MRLRLRIVAFVAFTLAPVSTVLGQTAQVTGRVTDTTAGALPGVAVTITSVDTGLTRTVVTNEEGSYTIPFLPPGRYRTTAELAGFSPAARENVVLSVDQIARFDFELAVEGVAESVEVGGRAPLMQRETSSLGQVIDNKTIVTLPLNGRNYTQLAVLMPGATPNVGSRAEDGFSVNGNRTFQNLFLVDGVDNNNYILGVDTNSMQAIRPPLDAVQEFKVESSNYSAEYGRSAGGLINVVIKSGTNTFSGSAFEFFRDDALDANDFFANRAGLEKAPLRYHQFGGTLGGPIARSRLFFFGSYQGTRSTRSETTSVSVPTPEQRRGHFGDIVIYDPANVVNGIRQPFLGNVIPPERLDPVGVRLAALYADPNQPGLVNNYAANVPRTDDADQIDGRVDYNVNDRTRLFGRYSRSERVIDSDSIFAPPGNGGAFGSFPLRITAAAYSGVVGATQVLSSSAVNEIRVSYTRNESDQLSPAAESLYDEFGIGGVPHFQGLTGLPTINVTNYTGLGDRTFAPNPKQADTFQVNNNLSLVRGTHSLKLGGEVWRLQSFAGTSSLARGSLFFNGQFTARIPGAGAGNALADLLLGQTSNAQLSTRLVGDFSSNYYAVYVNDSWKVTPRLTLNLGVRYDLQTRMREKENRQAVFDLNPGSPTSGTIVNAEDGDHRSETFSELDTNNFAPRLGAAFQLDDTTVLRGALGLFYGGSGFNAIAQSGAANPPYFINVSINTPTTATRSNLVLSDGFPPGTLSPTRAVNTAAYAQPAEYPFTTMFQGNIAIQRELTAAMVATIAYVGSSSRNLRRQLDVNAPLPGPGPINPRRPFPDWGAITVLQADAETSYHALQAKLERRFTRGLSVLASYTWSHAIDDAQDNEDGGGNGPVLPQNPLNLAAEKASAGIDVRQRLVTSFVYDVPLGRAGGVLGASPVMRAIFGGYRVSGIFVAQGGPPVNPGVAGNPANTTGPIRPNRLADGNLPRDERSVDRWFDLSAFAVPPPFTYGDSGRNVLRAPGLVNVDLVVARDVPFGGDRRLEFRAEFFNLTNSAHFARPNATIGSPQAGLISSTAQANRQVQLGVRFVF